MTPTTDLDKDRQTGTTTTDHSSTGRFGSVKSKAGDAYSSTRERTSAAYGSARQGASRAKETTSQSIDSNPGIALIGGLAIGALAAALLPKSRKEQELLGTYGKQINDRARQAANAAKEAGQSKLDELGLNKEAAKQKLSEVAKQAGEAVKTSATAAAQAAKTGQGQGTGASSTTGQFGQTDPLAPPATSSTSSQQGF